MHKSLVQMLCFLCTNKVLFSTTMNSINKLHGIKYSKEQVNYYNAQTERIDNHNKHYGAEILPDVFAKFDTLGKYNGLQLTASLSKKFLQYIENRKKHMQSSF